MLEGHLGSLTNLDCRGKGDERGLSSKASRKKSCHSIETRVEVNHMSRDGEDLCVIDRGDTMYKGQAMKENTVWP